MMHRSRSKAHLTPDVPTYAKISSTSATPSRSRIANAVTALADLPNAQNVKALTNYEYGHRLRIGNYRVLFDADTVIRIVEIQEVKKRDGNTY